MSRLDVCGLETLVFTGYFFLCPCFTHLPQLNRTTSLWHTHACAQVPVSVFVRILQGKILGAALIAIRDQTSLPQHI